MSKDSKAVDKSKNKLRKRQKDRDEAREDAVVEISLNDAIITNGTSSSEATATTPTSEVQLKMAPSASAAIRDAGDSEVDSEVDEQEKALERKAKGKGKANGVKAFEQRDLVALAFAGDNVIQVRSSAFCCLTARSISGVVCRTSKT